MKLIIIITMLLISTKIFSDNFKEIDSLTITFIGDIMNHKTQIDAAYNKKTKSYDYSGYFEKISSIISASDLTVANLEVTLAGKPYTGYPTFSAPDELAIACKNSGMDVLVTSNNHSCDKRKNGIVRTIKVLDSLQISHTGTFIDSTEREKNNLLIIEKNCIKIGILNYTELTNNIPTPKHTVVNRIDTTTILNDIKISKKHHLDKLILFLHWGDEYKSKPNKKQITLAKFLFRNGVDIIIGSHPHTLQKMEYKDGKFIAYSLGNFVSDQRTRKRDGGAIVQLTITKDGDNSSISNYGYYLTWVHKYGKGSLKKHEVLLCSQVENDNYKDLDKSSKEKIKLFISDSRKLLKKENLLVKELLLKNANDSTIDSVITTEKRE